MNISDFFTFSSKLLSSTFQTGAVSLKNGLDDYPNLIKGYYTGIDFPVIFKQDHGKNLTDILDTGWPGFFLISNRMKSILEENNLTGWKTFPIKIFDKKKTEVPHYHGFSVVGHCGPIKYEKAGIIEKRMVPEGPICEFYKGLYVGLDEWDGADFFTPKKNYTTIITKKTADILKKNKITNLSLENLAEIETSVD
jgi:hypothetical protein